MKLRLFDYFNTSYIFRYSHTVSLLPSITIEQICLLPYSWEENDYQEHLVISTVWEFVCAE